MGPPRRRREGVWRRLDREVVDDVLVMLERWGRMTAQSGWERVDASIKGKAGTAQWGRIVVVSAGARALQLNLRHHHAGTGAVLVGACGFEHAQGVHDADRAMAEGLLYETYDEARRQRREANRAAESAMAQSISATQQPAATAAPSAAPSTAQTDATEFLATMDGNEATSTTGPTGAGTGAELATQPRLSRWDR